MSSGTGREIWEQDGRDGWTPSPRQSERAGRFVGVSRALKSRNPRVKCYAVEPTGAPYLAGGEVTNTRHQIQGAGYAMDARFSGTSRWRTGNLAVSDEEAEEAARPFGASGGGPGGLLDGGESSRGGNRSPVRCRPAPLSSRRRAIRGCGI